MATATTTVTCNSTSYTQLTAASTGYSLIYNPLGFGRVLEIVVASSQPSATTDARMSLNPDEAFPRTSDITDIIWGKVAGGDDIKVVVTE
jgi:hypothetical protein